MDVKCPGCGEELEADDSLAGQEVKCSTCDHGFKLAPPAPPPRPAKPPPPQPASPAPQRYRSKKAIRKDKIGVGVLLEILGIAIGIFTLPSVIGPIIGLAMFGCGFAIARQKRFVCVSCGNELAPESKECPTCKAQYEK